MQTWLSHLKPVISRVSDVFHKLSTLDNCVSTDVRLPVQGDKSSLTCSRLSIKKCIDSHFQKHAWDMCAKGAQSQSERWPLMSMNQGKRGCAEVLWWLVPEIPPAPSTSAHRHSQRPDPMWLTHIEQVINALPLESSPQVSCTHIHE